MRRIAATLAVAAAALVASPVIVAPLMAQDQPRTVRTLDELLSRIRQGRTAENAENREREERFRREQSQRQAMLSAARNELAALEARAKELETKFNENELELARLNELKTERLGAFGEMFGVLRQVAGDMRGIVGDSIISVQYPGRAQFLGDLQTSTDLPTIKEMERLAFILLQEAVEQGKIVKFATKVLNTEGREADREVSRIGAFVAVSDGDFLSVTQSGDKYVLLKKNPPSQYVSAAGDVEDSIGSGEIVDTPIDPSRGQLLGLYVDAPSLPEYVQAGGYIGYATIALGGLGALIALERIFSLFMIGRAVRAQTRRKSASSGNPLGRVLKVYEENQAADVETLELKLDDAILKELPKLERGIGLIKLIAAVAPLLGLLGTVVGMILTFQQITLFGTGDPKIMAGGISLALVTTVIGLCVAIPMLLLHGIASARSRTVVQVLEEQAAGLVAQRAESERRR